ncbi:MAG TPA: nuclear transport factor 2 family protein [Chloroflexota bacterium]|nr:nuclear transport factor 2 family protein [Chloroflexota bacterium]
MTDLASPVIAVERLRDAINSHDLEAMVACFTSEYESSFPAHPDRAFQGSEQVRTNWARIFDGVPDLTAALLGASVQGDTVWAEWEWKGMRRDGVPFHQRGVTIQGTSGDQLAWARLYMEPVEVGRGVDASVREALAPADRS